MNAINIDIPIEMIVDAVLHRLDTNKRFFSKLGDVVANKLIARANSSDLSTAEWLNRLRNRFDSNWNPERKFDSAVSQWLSDNYANYARAIISATVCEQIGRAIDDAKLNAVKEIRADVVSLLIERQADLTNEQLIILLNALTDKE